MLELIVGLASLLTLALTFYLAFRFLEAVEVIGDALQELARAHRSQRPPASSPPRRAQTSRVR